LEVLLFLSMGLNGASKKTLEYNIREILMNTPSGHERRTTKREYCASELDVRINPNTMEGTSVDISEGGVRFDTKNPLEIDIRFRFEKNKNPQVGRLVWAKKKSTGDGFTYAFEFIDLKQQVKK
jgi:hypothetical protein